MMKTKFFVIFAAFLFAAITAYNLQLAQTQNLGDISLADITVMAQADGEATIECHQYWIEGRCNQCYEKISDYSCWWTGSTLQWCCI